MTIKEAIDVLDLWCCAYPYSKLGSEYSPSGRLLTPMIELTTDTNVVPVTPLMEEAVKVIRKEFKNDTRYEGCFDYTIECGEVHGGLEQLHSKHVLCVKHVDLDVRKFLRLYKSRSNEVIESIKGIDGSNVLDEQDYIDLLNGNIYGLKVDVTGVAYAFEDYLGLYVAIKHKNNTYSTLLDISPDGNRSKLTYRFSDWSEI